MRPTFIVVNRLSIVAACTLSVTACGSKTTAPPEKSTTQSTQAATAPNNLAAVRETLLAAAEPFEVLTEGAFRSDPAKLETLVAATDDAVRRSHGILPQNTSGQLATQVSAIKRARQTNARADLARASIEAYRTLVSAVPGNPPVPIAVSLLDYAGFRYDADTQARPPRWDDMALAVSFARDQWAGLSKDKLPGALRQKFSAALVAMELAMKKRDVVSARTSAKAELDLVDELEKAYTPVSA